MSGRLIRIIILGSLFFIPLLGPYRDFGYEKTKVIFFLLSTSLVGFIWLLTKPKLQWDLIKIASLVFILVLFATSGLGLDFRASFLGTEPYFQGLALYAYLFLFSILVSSVKIKLEHVTMILTGSALVVSLVAIQSWVMLNIFNIPVQTYAGRVVSTFGQPNFYSGFLLLTLPFSYYLFKQTKLLGVISGLVSVIGIFVSYSRSAILVMLLLLILGLIDQLKIKLRIILIIFPVLLYSSGIIGDEVSLPILTKNPDLTKVSVEKRAYIWPVAWQLVKQKPLIGYGLENIGQAFSNYFEANKHPLFEENLNISPVLISLKELNIDRSHNYFLDLLLFSGIPGLLVWIFLVAVLLFRSKGILLVSLITYLVWAQFQNQSIVHLVYFWLLVGIINQARD